MQELLECCVCIIITRKWTRFNKQSESASLIPSHEKFIEYSNLLNWHSKGIKPATASPHLSVWFLLIFFLIQVEVEQVLEFPISALNERRVKEIKEKKTN